MTARQMKRRFAAAARPRQDVDYVTTGTAIATSVASGGVFSMNLADGVSITDVHYVVGYVPAVLDVVRYIKWGQEYFVLGKQS